MGKKAHKLNFPPEEPVAAAKKEAKKKEDALDKPKRGQAGDRTKATQSAAQISNQERLFEQIERQVAGPTYIQPDSKSWIEPYNQRDHAWTVGQYDMSNQTSWTEDPAAAKGYRSPINGGNHSFAQGPTYIQPDSKSWIEPYNQRDHAWTVGQYDMSNQTSWTEDPAAAKGYRSPINGGNHSFAQAEGPTYIQPDSKSWIEPYNQRDHAWTVGQHDMSNETSWTEDPAAAKGYRSPINGGNHSFAQGPTYIQPDSKSWIEPYNQRDHAWTTGQYDMSNQTSWTEDPAAAKGYRSPINGGNHSFAQTEGPTYIQPDSKSWIEPYNQRDHAWTVGQYDQSNQTSWTEDPAAAKGYRSPINGGKHSFAQDDLHPYRKNAWNDDAHAVSNEAQWAADAPAGYRQPISGKHSLSGQNLPQVGQMSMSEALLQIKSEQRPHELNALV